MPEYGDRKAGQKTGATYEYHGRRKGWEPLNPGFEPGKEPDVFLEEPPQFRPVSRRFERKPRGAQREFEDFIGNTDRAMEEKRNKALHIEDLKDES